MGGRGLFRSGSSLVGIDIGSSSVKVAQVRRTRKGHTLVYAGLREIPPEGESPQNGEGVLLLQELLKEGRLTKSSGAINCIDQSLLIRYMTFPAMPVEEIREAAKWEIKKSSSSPLDQLAWDFLVAGEVEEEGVKKTEVILVACEKGAVTGRLTPLTASGIEIVAVDVNPLSLLNSIRLTYPEDLEGSIVFIDIGARKTDINIAMKGVLRMARTVQIGGNDLTRALQKEFSLTHSEAEQIKRDRGLFPRKDPLADKVLPARSQEVMKKEVDRLLLEIQRSVDYYLFQTFPAEARDSQIRKVLLMGGGALLSGLREYLSSFFPNLVETHNPFARIRSPESLLTRVGEVAPRFASAVGLSLRGRES